MNLPVHIDGPEYRQKLLSNRMRFVFGEEQLSYTFEDSQHRYRYAIDYDDVPFTQTEFTERFEALRATAILWAVLGVFYLVRAVADGAVSVTAIVLFALAALSYLGYRKLDASFTVFDTQMGRLLIAQDKQHDEILSEIVSRRRDVILKSHGEVDLDNDPEQERAKFAWLRARGVITEDEYQEKLREIEGAAPMALAPSTPSGGPGGGPGGGTVH